jgi:hypothetical protein
MTMTIVTEDSDPAAATDEESRGSGVSGLGALTRRASVTFAALSCRSLWKIAMRDRNSRCRRMVTFLGLLLAFSAMACNGGPTEPSFDELPGIYTGRWRGNINAFEIVLDVQAEPGRAKDWVPVGLRGTGTGLNSATGESHRLTIRGSTAGGNTTSFTILTALETGPGGVILGGGEVTGWFEDSASRDGRTWPGKFRSIPDDIINARPIFGPGEYSVTLIKE